MKTQFFAPLMAVVLMSVGSAHQATSSDLLTVPRDANGAPTLQIAQAKSAPEIYTDPKAGDNLAIRGYDAVAYFTQRQPVKGSALFSYQWKGATWHFASARNLSRFKADPEAYAPQYGGYCAKALSDGNLASTVPEVWDIVDGKLYLNYSVEAQQEWKEDVPGKIAKANTLWPDLLKTAGVIYYDTVGAVKY